jgi:hypothetical protein
MVNILILGKLNIKIGRSGRPKPSLGLFLRRGSQGPPAQQIPAAAKDQGAATA